MIDFEKIKVFDSRLIVHQEVKKVTDTNIPKHLEGKIYGVTIKLNNGDKIYFELTESDYFDFLAHIAWHNGNIYVLYIDNSADEFFSSYETLRKRVTGEK